jgi:UDP-N-acetylglucosamine 2-epimerase (non-hydrolysing)
MACSITAKKLCTRVAHIEAGIRSFDLTMPEAINRMVTDSITDMFFTTSQVANENLRKAGVPEERIFFAGNVMIDTLLANFSRLVKPDIFDTLKLQPKKYIMLTLHRPANVDDSDCLAELLNAIHDNANDYPVIFPVHPRTRKVINDFSPAVLRSCGLAVEGSEGLAVPASIHLTEPMGYLEFNYLVKHAFAVITDSGGITEETTVMGVPCMTLRDSTERPETCTVGTNELLGTDPAAIKPAMQKLFAGQWKKGGIPEKWDGHAAERIVEVIIRELPKIS